jgi:hypothetical protein
MEVKIINTVGTECRKTNVPGSINSHGENLLHYGLGHDSTHLHTKKYKFRKITLKLR